MISLFRPLGMKGMFPRTQLQIFAVNRLQGEEEWVIAVLVENHYKALNKKKLIASGSLQ